MRKALIAVITAAVLFAVGAFAAELTVNSDNLASGQDEVEPCGSADVEWTTNDAIPTGGGDWEVTGATVTFSDDACDGAAVDLAVGLNPTTGASPASAWENWACSGVVTAATNSISCTPTSGSEPAVSDVVDVAVLANGNSVPATA